VRQFAALALSTPTRETAALALVAIFRATKVIGIVKLLFMEVLWFMDIF
jgi:hypothetical protein